MGLDPAYHGPSSSGDTPASGDLEWVQSYLADVVSMPVSDTWYDGPSVTFGIGTWLVLGYATYRKGATTAASVAARFYDSDQAETYASQQAYHTSLSGTSVNFSMQAIIVVASHTRTVKLQLMSSAGNAACEILDTTTQGPSGDTATSIRAIKIAA